MLPLYYAFTILNDDLHTAKCAFFILLYFLYYASTWKDLSEQMNKNAEKPLKVLLKFSRCMELCKFS